MAGHLSKSLHGFIKSYVWLAANFFESGTPGFGLYPKLHGLHEVQHLMARQVRLAGFAWNPATQSCSVDEDFIGRCAALSRSVSPRLTSLRTIQRYLCHIQIGWSRHPLPARSI